MTLAAESRSVSVYFNAVRYIQDGVGCFPGLVSDEIAHGFSWGAASQNMAYAYHEGDPDVITARNQALLGSLGMDASLAVTIAATTEPQLVDVDPAYVANWSNEDPRRFASAHTLLTVMRGQPLTIKPGDCSSALVRGWTGEGAPVIGIVHGSRKELDAGFPRDAIEYCVSRYGCDPAAIQIGIVPSISTANHDLKRDDIAKHIDESVWSRHIEYDNEGNAFLDGAGFAIEQFMSAGVLPGNIECYRVDTYEAAGCGEGFSHRYTTQTGERMGRFILAVQIN